MRVFCDFSFLSSAVVIKIKREVTLWSIAGAKELGAIMLGE
jgi:uncharacterized membrane protein